MYKNSKLFFPDLGDIDRGYFDFKLFKLRKNDGNIFGTRAKSNTVYESVEELDLPDNKDKIITLMNKHPEMVIELGSFTDCRATEQYNKVLSTKRAKASAQYTKNRITNPKRIYGKGYDESHLIKEGCSCENEPIYDGCSDDTHEINKRTEFKIIKSNVNIKNTSSIAF